MVTSRFVKCLLCPVLAGRDAELQAVTAALDDAAKGSGGVVVVIGDAGVGKSRLARETTAAALAGS
jgi:predicted ATPase